MRKFSSGLIAGLLFTSIFASGTAFGQVLTHGPVVGGVTASGAQVFVRADQASTVALRYGTDPTLATYQTSAAFNTDSSSDFTRIISLTDLSAETPYYLDVLVNGVPQLSGPPYPSFTTFPPDGTSRDFKFVAFSDFETVTNLTGSVQTFASAAATRPAFVFIGGDFDHRNPLTLDDKRAMFRDLYDPATPNMSDFAPLILQQFPIVHQWDDHDAGANNIDKNYTFWSLSQQAFQEYVPSYPLPPVTPGIWQKFSYAQMDCFVLDCRSQRDREKDPDDSNKSMLDGNALGATGQLQWLENGLLASTAVWKVIFTSVVTNTGTKFPDGWAGYQTEWRALRDFINTNGIQNVVFISGDLHLAAIDNGSDAGFPEMCLSQANATRTGYCATAPPGNWSEGYYTDSCSGYGLITITQNPAQLTLQSADQFGNIHLSYTVNVGQGPVITSQPADVTVLEGTKAAFTVSATGDPPLQYQWKKNGVQIDGATQSQYLTPKTTAADNGSVFAVTVTNSKGSVTSNDATLTVKSGKAPTITTQPHSQKVAVGQTAGFRVVASGSRPLHYQWTKDGVDISGATNSFYITPPATLEDNGSLFACSVSNRAGSVTSNNAVLVVLH